MAIPLLLAVRLLSVGLPTLPMRLPRAEWRGVLAVLTWGGLRGGISVSLALGLPESAAARTPLLTVTYAVVIFTIVVQGLSMGPVTRRFFPSASAEDAGLSH